MSLTWDVPPDLFAGVVTEDTSDLVRAIGITVLNNLQLLSPVDEGTYRANHNVSFDSPDYSFDMNLGSMSASFSALNNLQRGEIKTVYFTNASPYGERLENGWSGQAPSGVYGLAFESTVAQYT